MLHSSQQALFTLLRIALGQERVYFWSSDVDLRSLVGMAKSQGVSHIACDGLRLLYDQAERDEKILQDLSSFNSNELEMLRFNWLGETMRAERSYKQYVQRLSKLLGFFSSNGIRAMVMKGYGLSLNYPIPSHRPIGDIDLYLFDEAERGDHLLKSQLGVAFLPNEPHHSVFLFENGVVENHHHILNIYKHPSNKKLEALLEKLAEESVATTQAGVTFYLPSVKFNSVHLLRHMASDFATVTTTLRHVLDWCTFVNAHAEAMDWGFLRKVAHEANMHRFLDALNSICVDYLGCAPERFPIEKRDDGLRDRVLTEILNPAFQEAIPSRKNMFAYGWVKLKRLWRNRWKHQIVFRESFGQLFYYSLKNRIFKSFVCFTK
ncbi:MAG: nucleotidyltransferase family protein [Paludibacteraceae bacterium]|nr:nucleotidyltransferase family protein [Paludibacteraceae bacterium]